MTNNTMTKKARKNMIILENDEEGGGGSLENTLSNNDSGSFFLKKLPKEKNKTTITKTKRKTFVKVRYCPRLEKLSSFVYSGQFENPLVGIGPE
jgi:hypothetical protein